MDRALKQIIEHLQAIMIYNEKSLQVVAGQEAVLSEKALK